MTKKKTDIFKRLTRSHLEAIGRVAATWSLLESTMMSAIRKISGIELEKVIALAGPSAFASWADMLILLASESQEHKDKVPELERLIKLLLKLQNRRNSIVHAIWQIPRRGRGLINSVVIPITPRDSAYGFGIPKRGRDGFTFVSWTPPQMRKIATTIEETRLMLSWIAYRQPPASQPERDAQHRRRGTTLTRIDKLLDTLPHPFPQSPKRRRDP